MNLNDRNLTKGTQGDDVKLLQSELRRLGYVIADGEVAPSLFGETTLKAVVDFQKSHGLTEDGIVGENTRKELSVAIAGLQDSKNREPIRTEPKKGELKKDDFKPPSDSPTKLPPSDIGPKLPPNGDPKLPTNTPPISYVIQGQIGQTDEKPAIGLMVRAFNKDASGSETKLGESVSDEDGRYKITYLEALFSKFSSGRNGLDIVLRVFDQTHNMNQGWNAVRITKPVESIEPRQVSWLPWKELEAKPFNVSGQVLWSDGRPAISLTVRAFDKDLRSEEELGKAVTDKQGHYEINYSASQFRRNEKDSADLVVRVSDGAGTLPVSSPIIFNAKPVETVDLSFGGESRGLSEYETMVKELVPLLQGVPMSELVENEDQKDISFLAGETGFDPRRITWLVQAANLERETHSISAEVFYGLFRQKLPTNLKDLLGQVTLPLRRSLERSVLDNIIPPLTAAELDEIVNKLHALRADLLLKPAGANREPSLGDLLNTSQLTTDKKRVVAVLHLEHDGATEAFRTALSERKEFNEKEIKAVRLTLQLAALTSSHLPLVIELQRIASADTTTTPTDGIPASELRSLARLDVADWEALLKRPQANGQPIGAPVTTPGANTNERINNYAVALNQYIENVLPTTVIASRLEKDIGEDSPFKSTQTDLKTFFANNPSFEFGVTPVDLYLSEGHAQKLLKVNDPTALMAQLKGMGRIFNITRRYPEMRALLADDLHSAQAIVRVGQRRFTEKYALPLGGPTKALGVYSKAKHVHATALNVYMKNAAAFNSPTPFVISGGAIASPVIDNGGNSFSFAASVLPNLSTLFGSLDLCNCEHCLSLYSPAAYLVDILRFLGDGPLNRDHMSPLQVLLAHRPDIEHIELTCENTNTQLPYVDLAIEILEAAIAPRSFHVTEGLDVSSVLADLDSGEIPASFVTAFADNGYALSDKASVRSDTTAGVDVHWSWIILDDGWAFTFKRVRSNEGFQVFAWPQTSWTTSELRANPEHVQNGSNPPRPGPVNPWSAVYPWNLPLDRPLEEMRAYLAHLGVQRHQVMETFFRDSHAEPIDNSNIAYEYLGLSREEADLVTGVTTGAPADKTPGAWNFWGLQNSENEVADLTDGTAPNARGDWDVVLKRVSIFLQQSGLSYKELLELLGTHFINPVNGGGRTLGIVSVDHDDAATCKLSKLEIQVVDSESSNPQDELIAAWGRIHRFVRLSGKLGWTMRDLDKAITALTPVAARREITQPFLVELSYIQRLRAKLNVPLVNMLSWFADIDTSSYIDHLADGQPEVGSLYKQLFLNKTVIKPVDEAFTEDANSLSGNLSDHLPTLVAALGITAADLSLLTTGTAAVIRDDNLNLANLSRVYRVVSLARALKLTIPEYLSIRKLSGIDPFAPIPAAGSEPATPATRATLRFVETVDFIRASEFSIDELDYLLRHHFGSSSGVAPSEDEIAATLHELRSELQKIADENTVREEPDDPNGATTDPHGELTRKKLALLNWDTGLIEQLVATLNGSVTYEVITERLSPTLQLPNATGNDEVGLQEGLRGRITYDEVVVNEQPKGRLRFTGPMTNARKARLEIVSGVRVYRDAVKTLYDAPRNFVASYARTFSIQEFATDLAVLPANVSFPVPLRSKVYFDAVALSKQLHFIGVMTDQQRDALLDLSDARSYVAAVNSLFEQAQPDFPRTVTPQADAFLTAPADTAILFDNPTAPAERFLLVLKRLLPYLRRTLSERTVAHKVAAALNLETKTAAHLLTKWVNSPTRARQKSIAEFLAPNFADSSLNIKLTAAAFPDQFKTFTRLHKIAFFVTRFKITPDQLDWIFEHGPSGGWLDFNVLPVIPVAPNVSSEALFVSWRRLFDLFRLRDTPGLGELALFNLFDLAIAVLPSSLDADKNTAKKKYLENLIRHTLWPIEELETLLGSREDHRETGRLHYAFPDDYKDERMLLRLRECLKLMKRIGASATQLSEWAKANQTAADELNNAHSIKNTVKAKYDEEQWPAVAKPLKDPLREKRRSALVSYLVAQRGVRDANELYDDFLIDVDMGPCMMTTRIKQAISSVQLFIQRTLMNLETDVSLTRDEAKEWAQWRKWYRVWEANRKVLLYPENWIEPELRDDKSPFFKELENELLQSDVTMDTAEDAFLHYLEKLDQVARLEIVGMYSQHEPKEILHVFGRTYAVPHIYFYRRLEDKVWSAWEKADLDIEGDHLIPVVWNRRLYLFWAIFTEKSEQPTREQRSRDEDPNKYWEIKLASSEYKNGGWSPKKVSKNALRHNKYPYLPDLPLVPRLVVPQEQHDFSFKTREPQGLPGEQLSIGCYGTIVVRNRRDPGPAPITPLPPTNTQPLGTILPYIVPVFPPRNIPQPTYIRCRLRISDRRPNPARTEIQLRKPSGVVLETIRLNANGIAYSRAAYTEPVIPYLVSTEYMLESFQEQGSWWMPLNFVGYVTAIVEACFDALADAGFPVSDGVVNSTIAAALAVASAPAAAQITVSFGDWISVMGVILPLVLPVVSTAAGLAAPPDAAGRGIAAAENAGTRPFGRGVAVRVKAIPPAPPVELPAPVYETTALPMQGIGVFTLDGCHGDLSAKPVASTMMVPMQLELIGNTQFQNMMLVEKPGDHSLSVGINQSETLLRLTPGIFRLLVPHQDSHFTRESPFFFQDGQRTYFVSLNEARSFAIHFHPRVCTLIEALNRDGVAGLLTPQNQAPDTSETAFLTTYLPTPPHNSDTTAPKEDVDFKRSGAYSLYNWELFFHTPLLIAVQLSNNQRFEEAQKWFHFIFDPTATEPPANPSFPGPERFWRVRPFYDEATRGIQPLEALLADAGTLEEQVTEWEAHPFKPHVIARMRLVAYMKTVVMRYIDNLIAWGDQLFRRDTIESINEATQLYILAAQILGRRPESIPPRAKAKVQTFRTLDDVAVLDSLSNAIVEIEGFLSPSAAPVSVTGAPPLTMRYFGVPGNDKLQGYWDTVADRLFKIRHCQNIEGVERSLPMFEPPIDPALLVRAAAAGVDIASALNDINAAVPHYRFNVMVQKATELCSDLKALGAALLSALEKRDAETLALLRSSHEVELLKAIREIKAQQIKEANNTLAGLMKYEDVVTIRQQYYLNRPFMNSFEMGHIALVGSSLTLMRAQVGAEVLAAVLHLIPGIKTGAPTTIGATYGGDNVGPAAQAFGSAAGTTASILNTSASLSSTLGSYERRQEDWTHQAELATKELQQVKKQIAAAEIRLAISERELQNHDLQIEHAKGVDAYMRSQKFTNQQLYNWMVGQLSGIYFQSYQLAFDIAKRAERAYRYELGLRDSNFIQFGYWDSLKKGLLSGERLHHDLKRMDVAYLDQNKREYEITKHISLVTIDPISLVKLRETGECFVSLPEALFDLDYPGHYMRRIKSVSLTIPCVTGPYAGVNCTLTQLNSSIRHANTLSGSQHQYSRGADDSRFADSFGVIQSIVTSHGQSDGGLFETNLRDERYLPFEGAGVISTWRIELPSVFPAFDYNTISDVVLHVRYTARDGGGTLKQRVAGELTAAINSIEESARGNGLARLFSLRQEFPTEWHRLVSGTNGSGARPHYFAVTKNRFPFLFTHRQINISAVDFYAVPKSDIAINDFPALDVKLPMTTSVVPMEEGVRIGNLLAKTLTLGTELTVDPEEGNAQWEFQIPQGGLVNFQQEINDILMVCHYTI